MSCFRGARNSLRSKLNIRVLFWVMPRFVALRCFEWVIASWADLAESAALRLFKVEAGINGLRPACGGSPPFNPFLP